MRHPLTEPYKFNNTDRNIVEAAQLLLRKLCAPGTIRSAQLVTVAKLHHVLLTLPKVTYGVAASATISTRMKYAEIMTLSWWTFSVDEGKLSIECGGHEHDPAIGGDSYTTMSWSASPGEMTEYNDRWDEKWMVPDLGYYPDRNINIDFASGEYTVEITDSDNPLLEDSEDQAVEKSPDSQNTETFDSLWTYCEENNRLVPAPPEWADLHGMLANRQQKLSGGWEPSAPLILAAWHCTMPIEKHLRFKEHIQWAADHNQLEEVGAFLRSLPEDGWVHIGEV
jgi:hypothetical protein